MITFYKNINNHTEEIKNYEQGCWINCVEPTEEERDILINNYKVEPEILRSSLDEEESSHIDFEDKNTLIVIDIPIVKREEKNLSYETMPLSIILTENDIITVSINDNPIIAEFEEGIVKNANTNLRTQFVFFILLRITSRYLQYLKQIDKITHQVEIELRKSMKNKELIQLLEIEKSLVYLSSSLKTNETTILKIKRGRVVKIYDEDQDLIEDVLIEVRQGIEMSNIYLNILSSTMEAFSSLISNNLNIVMKILASITVIMSIPTVISGFYGMNFNEWPLQGVWWLPFVLSVAFMGISWYILKKKDML